MSPTASRKSFDWKNLRLRVLSAAILGPLVIGLVWLGGPAFLVLVACAVALLAVEWGLMATPATPFRSALAICFATLMPVFAAWLGFFAAAWLLVPAGAAIAALVSKPGGFGERPADLVFGVLYIGAPATALVWLRSGEAGRDWTLMLLAITWSADIFAYAAGNLFKGPKLWPRFSPNKTWSGLVGGLAASALAGVIVVMAAKGEGDPTRGWAAVIGLAVGLFTMAGDLWESMLKRRFGVKDSGQLIPGHGGLLDRVDGLMFAILAMAGARTIAHLIGYL